MSEYRISEVGAGVEFNIYNIRNGAWKFVRKADTYAAACQLIAQWNDRSNDGQCGCSPESYQIDQRVMDAIATERQRQIDKWGRYKDMPPPTWLMILGEEFGEACAAAHDTLYDVAGKADEDHLDAELVQVAAVAIAWLEERRLGMSMCRPEFRHDYAEEATNEVQQ